MKPLYLKGDSMPTINIPMKEIVINDDPEKYADREVSEDRLLELMDSIELVGLQSPVGVIETPEGNFELVFGRNRLTAFQRLQKRHQKNGNGNGNGRAYDAIPCVLVDNKYAQIAQLDENLARIDLSEPERVLWATKRAALIAEIEITRREEEEPSRLRDEADALTKESKDPQLDDLQKSNARVKSTRAKREADRIEQEGLGDKKQKQIIIDKIAESDKVTKRTAALTLRHMLALAGTSAKNVEAKFKKGCERLERLLKKKNPLASRNQREAVSRLEPQAAEVIVRSALNGVQFKAGKDGVTPVLIATDKDGELALAGKVPVKKVPPSKRKSKTRLTLASKNPLEWSDQLFDYFGEDAIKQLITLWTAIIEDAATQDAATQDASAEGDHKNST